MKLLSSQPWGDKTHRYFLTREQVGGMPSSHSWRAEPVALRQRLTQSPSLPQEYVGGLKAMVGMWCVSLRLPAWLGRFFCFQQQPARSCGARACPNIRGSL